MRCRLDSVVASALSLSLPCREVACTMQESNDHYAISCNPIHQPIIENEQFSEVGLPQFRDDSPSFGERLQAGGSVEGAPEHAKRAVSRVLCDVGDDVVESEPGGISPNY